jgi:hypothetical protein
MRRGKRVSASTASELNQKKYGEIVKWHRCGCDLHSTRQRKERQTEIGGVEFSACRL